MIFKRRLYYTIKKTIKHRNAIVITGGRQVGKTTLMREIFNELPEKQKVWFDFDNPLDYMFFEEIDYNDLFSKLEQKGLAKNQQKYVFIDEIQNFPEITKIIKFMIDHYSIKFIVSGSASYYLQNLFPESLSGRKFLFRLDTLDFEEFLLFKGKVSSLSTEITLNKNSKDIFEYEHYDQEYQEFKNWGSYPEVVLEEDLDIKKLILKNIFSSYFEKDVIKFGDFKEVDKMRDLILLLAARIGSKLDITKLSSELGLSRNTIYNHLVFLEATFFIYLLPRFSKSIDRRKAGSKKVYFADSGMLNQIAQVSEGQLFENTVCKQLRNYGDLSYFQTRSANEIDFILNNNIAIEVKNKATESYFVKLKKISDSLKINEYYIISQLFNNVNSNVIYPQFL